MADQGKIPIPKSQREIANSLVKPTSQEFGNPNDFTKLNRSLADNRTNNQVVTLLNLQLTKMGID